MSVPWPHRIETDLWRESLPDASPRGRRLTLSKTRAPFMSDPGGARTYAATNEFAYHALYDLLRRRVA
jgi:hypothetical protein